MIDDLWHKNATFYCLHVGMFMDAIGDFEGLMLRLDYLAGISITAVWLPPQPERRLRRAGLLRRRSAQHVWFQAARRDPKGQ